MGSFILVGGRRREDRVPQCAAQRRESGASWRAHPGRSLLSFRPCGAWQDGMILPSGVAAVHSVSASKLKRLI